MLHNFRTSRRFETKKKVRIHTDTVHFITPTAATQSLHEMCVCVCERGHIVLIIQADLTWSCSLELCLEVLQQQKPPDVSRISQLSEQQLIIPDCRDTDIILWSKQNTLENPPKSGIYMLVYWEFVSFTEQEIKLYKKKEQLGPHGQYFTAKQP